MSKKLMSPPFYPQMSDDGIITNSDLADNTIYVEVRPYPGAAKGDYIYLHFGELTPIFQMVPEDVTWPLIFEVPASSVPDGVYLTYYTATDAAANTSFSATQYCLVFRSGDVSLPPPVFTDAESGELYIRNILSLGGTHVQVPAYPGIAVDDVVTLTTLVQDETGDFISDSQYTRQYTVTPADLAAGFILLVPESSLVVTLAGTVFARYSVHSDTRDALSTPASATLSSVMGSMLPAPWLPDAPYDVLTDASVVAAGGVRAALSYPDIQAGDTVYVYLRGLTASGVPVTTEPEMLTRVVDAAQVAAAEVDVLFSTAIPAAVIDGFLDCYYIVSRDSEAMRLSFIDHVQLVNSEGERLPAPTFLSATGDVLSINTVQTEGGTQLSVAYDSMTDGDQVRVWLHGQDEAGTPVPEAEYITTHRITPAEAAAREWVLTLPAAPLLAVGDSGHIFAEYAVYNSASGLLSRSYTSEVIMKEKATGDLQMVLTMDAPPTDHSVASYTAWNMGYLTGAPGMTVQVDCASGVIIQESGTNTYTLNLNESGHAQFRLYSAKTGTSDVVAFSVNNPALIVERPAIFKDYTRGEGDILAIANTTGAPANGVIPCSVYMVATSQITMARITITEGSAEIIGYPGQTSADIALSADHSAEMNLISRTGGLVKATITLPESSVSFALVTMAFTSL